MCDQTPPEEEFLLASFSQKFDRKLISDPKSSFHSIFCGEIVWKNRCEKIAGRG